MALQQLEEWAKYGFGTWTRFKLPSSREAIDTSIFETLTGWASDFRAIWYGRIEESPDECVLVVAWKTPEGYDKFKESTQHKELMATFSAGSPTTTEPETQTIICSNTMFFNVFGPNTEVLTGYLPTSTSPENQAAVHTTRRLIHAYEVGPPKSRCYGRTPNFGWIDGLQTWDGDQVHAAVWLHSWNDKESELRFKATEKRYGDYQTATRLVVDAFDQDLRKLGVVGFKSFHVDFKLFARGPR